MAYTPGLTWPRTDGDPSKWPEGEQLIPSTTNSYYRKVEYPHNKIDLYETKTAEHLAQLMGVKAANYRMKLPEGYALFAHHKPQGDGKERIDVYLRGCSVIGGRSFRSTQEFLPHAEWLMDTSKPLNDHTTCGCIYNSVSGAARAKKQPRESGSSSVPGSSKKPLSGSPRKRSKREASESSEEELGRTGITPDRAIDLKSQRRFRRGELVWFKIETLTPPSNKSNLPPITHWPGLVANIIAKTAADQNTILATAMAITGGTLPKAPAKPQKQIFECHIRPLGLFNPSAEVVMNTENMLPWSIGGELLGGAKGWEALGKEATRVINEGVKKEGAELKGKSTALPSDEAGWDKRWREIWTPRWPFRDMPRQWDVFVFRVSLALKIANTIIDAWTQTDKIDVLPGADINPEDLKAIQEQKKTLYQGLWWGGERLWLEDMVRLKKLRSELPTDALGEPSEGAADRAVMLKIRMITIDPAPGSTEGQHVWRCLLYGDVFEVANYDGPNAPKWTISADGATASITTTHPAAKGYMYRQLNDASSEVTVDIMDVAGRVYPDLLDPQTQFWFTSLSLSADGNKGRHEPGNVALALTGLKPGTLVESRSERWRDDLWSIVTESNKIVEKSMQKYYTGLLSPGLLKKPATPKQPAQKNMTKGSTAMDVDGAAPAMITTPAGVRV